MEDTDCDICNAIGMVNKRKEALDEHDPTYWNSLPVSQSVIMIESSDNLTSPTRQSKRRSASTRGSGYRASDETIHEGDDEDYDTEEDDDFDCSDIEQVNSSMLSEDDINFSNLVGLDDPTSSDDASRNGRLRKKVTVENVFVKTASGLDVTLDTKKRK
jgi:hypothetical protein